MGVSPFPPTEIIFQFPSTEKYSHRIIRCGAGRDLRRKRSPHPLPVHQKLPDMGTLQPFQVLCFCNDPFHWRGVPTEVFVQNYFSHTH